MFMAISDQRKLSQLKNGLLILILSIFFVDFSPKIRKYGLTSLSVTQLIIFSKIIDLLAFT